MNRMTNRIAIPAMVALIAVAGCKDSVTNPGSGLLIESRFEANGQPSLDPWVRVDTAKRAELFFSNDVPPDSTIHWSLGIKSYGKISRILAYSIPAERIGGSLRTFRLTYWSKGSSLSMPYMTPFLEVVSLNRYQGRSGPDLTSAWTQYTITINMDSPVTSVGVSIWSFSTSSDTTQYTLFTGFRLEGE